MFAVVDCDNFFVSCERIFRPDLAHVPVVVLSNNDGCVIARSKEVKKLGVKMGAPYFQYKSVLSSAGAVVFSANFELYNEISKRVRIILEATGRPVEHYSIDESFLELEASGGGSYEAWGQALSLSIMQWVGVPVSVGIGATKTLAKAAVWYAKKNNLTVFSVEKSDICQRVLQEMPVAEVWGIGRKISTKITTMGVVSAFDLIINEQVHRLFNKTSQGTVRELRGEDCIELHDHTESQASLAVTRSFGSGITEKRDLAASVAYFTRCAVERLRDKKLLCAGITVFIAEKNQSVGFSKKKYNFKKMYIALPYASQDTLIISQFSLLLVDALYKEGIMYKKAGVILSNLCSQERKQLTLDSKESLLARESQEDLFKKLDSQHKKGKVVLGVELNSSNEWRGKQQLKSSYGPRLSGLPTVNASEEFDAIIS